MRRALIALCAVGVLVPSLATASGPRARVWVSDQSPFAVSGSGFKAHEHIVVTATAGRRFEHAVTAGTGGGFVARWTSNAVAKSGCLSITIKAIGNRGSVATYKSAGAGCAPGPVAPGQ